VHAVLLLANARVAKIDGQPDMIKNTLNELDFLYIGLYNVMANNFQVVRGSTFPYKIFESCDGACLVRPRG